ncbi:MAG: Gfo/Idh/MocA family oxidoreductase [Clostridia bacterium]|nr:Gfo/Idh/MocA family oxidoreductase [Clostridia bacterium]
MIRIGMIGSDGGVQSGHAIGLCRILNNGNHPDVTITGIFGDNEEETRAIAEEQNIPFIAKTPEELVGKVDAVMIMPRDGGKHLAYAKPFLEAGIPMFVDKPFTCSVHDAEEFVALAQKSGSLLCGGSYVKYASVLAEIREQVDTTEEMIMSGYVSFPIQLQSPHGGMHFYSHHIIGCMLKAFGHDVEAVSASLVNGKLVAIAHYKKFPVIMNYASSYSGLHAGVYFDISPAIMKPLDYEGYDEKQCDLFLDMVRTGKGDETEELLLSVKISCAVEEAMKTGKTIRL